MPTQTTHLLDLPAEDLSEAQAKRLRNDLRRRALAWTAAMGAIGLLSFLLLPAPWWKVVALVCGLMAVGIGVASWATARMSRDRSPEAQTQYRRLATIVVFGLLALSALATAVSH